MKIYLYYFKHPEVPRSERMLYALTVDKDVAEKFENQRDMDKFIKIKKDITKDEYVYFLNYHSGKKLTDTKLESKDPYNYTKCTYIPVVCTWDEEKVILVKNEDMYSELFKGKMFDPSIFEIDVQIALLKLGFFTVYQWLYMTGIISLPYSMELYEGILDDMNRSDSDKPGITEVKMKTDQFSLFMHFYGETMKKE